MSRTREFLKRHVLWLAFVAVAIPLGILLTMQYRWLTDLEEASIKAMKGGLTSTAQSIAERVAVPYYEASLRLEKIDAELVAAKRYGKIARKIAENDLTGVRSVFLRDFHDPWGSGFPLYLGRDGKSFYDDRGKPENRAIEIASASYQLMAYQEQALKDDSGRVDHADPEFPVFVRPILDPEDRILAVIGFVPDVEWLCATRIPEVVEETLAGAWGDDADKIHVSIGNMDGLSLYANHDVMYEPAEFDAWGQLPWLFTNAWVGVKTTTTHAQLAHTNIWFNLGLSVLLGISLLGGIALALRAASRSMHLSELKADFVSNVSHELRTPIASIRVFGEFLGLGRVRDGAKIKEYGDYIESESRRLTQLINNILDFSKIETGGKTYRFETIDVREVVDEVLKTFEVRLRHSDFELDVELPEGDLTLVRADPDAIAQAVHNLLDNAVKYSNGRHRIRVGIEQGRRGVRVWVEDEGIGIPKDEHARIFERFHRVGTSLVHDVRGSGLGLSIVNHVVRAHGGRVSLESEPGKGSRFTIHLPAAKDAGDSVATGTRGERASA